MPIYEYRCRTCDHEFEALVRSGNVPACPQCGSGDLEQKLSMFAVSSEATRQSALKAGRAQQKKNTRDKLIAEQEEIEHHRH